MTWNLAQTMSLIKAAQHKYTHRKLISRDPRTGRARYRYYYARHHGGGITGAKFEAGAAFKLTYKNRRGHFHIQRVEGDTVFVKHDGRPGSKEVPMSQDELRALLQKQHSELETKGREKAQANRRKGRKKSAKKRKSTKRTKSTKRKKTQTQTPSEQPAETAQQGADNFETMPEELPNEPFEMRIARENIGKVQARLKAEREKGKTEHQLTKLNMMLESARKDYAIELAEYRAERETAQQGADNFETMPEVESTVSPDPKRQRLERLKRMYTPSKKKEITPDKYVISFAHRSGGKDHYLISIGDPRKQGSKTVGLVQHKESVQDWLSDNKNVNISENHIIDVSGLNLVSDEHTDDFMEMQAKIKEDIDRLQAELDRSEDETAQQAPQRSQTAQAFSDMVDTIKSGERSQKAQDAFKTELNKVIDKAESGTLTDAERAELLPIAEQLVEVTSGRARALMTAVRDQIKGSSEDGETAQVTDTRNPIARAVDQATPAHPTGYSSDAQGRLTISGFVAERYGYPTKKEAVADAKANGHSAGDVVSVSNRFWTGYAISRIDPVTKERVFFDKTSAEPEAIKVPLADKATHHRRGHLFEEGGDIRTTQRAQGQGFKV